jgi:hypothetical protein
MFCMSHIKEFHGKAKTRQAIQGYGGVEVYVYKGTLKWKIEDDKGRHHHLHSRSYLLRPKSDARLISPQHWAQKLTRKDRIWTKHAILTELSAGHFMTSDFSMGKQGIHEDSPSGSTKCLHV